MLTLKRIFILMVAAFVSIPAVMAQNSNREMSVEESYLQESIELMVIRETSRADSRDQKLVALEYIGAAIDRGNKGDDVRQALEYLSMEGVMIKSRENGRLTNNYPDIRRQAAKYLGQVGTPEARTALIKICIADNEPMVLQEAIKSLGDIDPGNNEDVIDAIFWTFKKFDVLNPDNLLALSAIDALAKIAERNNGIKDPNAVQALIRIAGGPYIRPVQDRAKQVLADLRKYNAQGEQNNNQQKQNQSRN